MPHGTTITHRLYRTRATPQLNQNRNHYCCNHNNCFHKIGGVLTPAVRLENISLYSQEVGGEVKRVLPERKEKKKRKAEDRRRTKTTPCLRRWLTESAVVSVSESSFVGLRVVSTRLDGRPPRVETCALLSTLSLSLSGRILS